MTLATSQIYYYGINEKTLEMEISSFAYSSEKNCYIASDCQPVFCDEFAREVKRKCFISGKFPNNRQEDLQGL